MNYAKVAQALRDLADAIDGDEDEAPKKAPAKAAAKKPAPPADDDDEDEKPAPKKKAPAKKPAADDDDDSGYDYQKDIRPHVVGLSKDHGREVALEVLEKFTNPVDDEPCTKGDQVAPEDYDRLLKLIAKKRAQLEADD